MSNTHEDKVAKLTAKLLKARSQFLPVLKTKINPYHKSHYADLNDFLTAVSGPMADNGLAVTCFVSDRESVQTSLESICRGFSESFSAGKPDTKDVIEFLKVVSEISKKEVLERHACKMVTLTLYDTETGFSVSSEFSYVSPLGDIQKHGSAITYIKRYLLSSMLMISGEDDDDGESALGRETLKTDSLLVGVQNSDGEKESYSDAKKNVIKYIRQGLSELGISEQDFQTECSFGLRQTLEMNEKALEVINEKLANGGHQNGLE